MKKIVILLVAVVISVVSIAFGVAQSSAATLQPVRPYWVDRDCPASDSLNCYWDAEVRGNGQGHSYITRQVPNSNGLVCVFYTEIEWAKTHDYCAR